MALFLSWLEQKWLTGVCYEIAMSVTQLLAYRLWEFMACFVMNELLR
jgi:hypothetical protein